MFIGLHETPAGDFTYSPAPEFSDAPDNRRMLYTHKTNRDNSGAIRRMDTAISAESSVILYSRGTLRAFFIYYRGRLSAVSSTVRLKDSQKYKMRNKRYILFRFANLYSRISCNPDIKTELRYNL